MHKRDFSKDFSWNMLLNLQKLFLLYVVPCEKESVERDFATE